MKTRLTVQGSSWHESEHDATISCALPNHAGLLNDAAGFRLTRTALGDAKRNLIGSGHDFEFPRHARMSQFSWRPEHDGMYTGLRLVKEKT